MNATKNIVEVNRHVTEHFEYNDFVCPCCDALKLFPGFYRHLELLERMRQELGFPISVNSGHRCEKHNREVGGAARSYHLLFATDLRPSSNSREQLKAMTELAPEYFNGIGKGETFLHVDCRPEKTTWRY